MRHITLSIVVVTYNIVEKIQQNYEQIMNYPNTEIILIDNNSTDGTYELLRKLIKKNSKLIKNSENIGFSRAVNQGIRCSTGEKILLLNPDTIPNNSAIKKLEKYLENKTKKIGLVGGRMIHTVNKTINGTCVNKATFLTGVFEFTNLKKIFRNNSYSVNFYYKNKKINKPLSVYGLSGGFLMFRRSLTEDIGFFDENFFMYLEDVDFGLRAKQANYLNFYIPESVILHDSGSSSKHSPYRINVQAWRKSRNYFFKKHFNFFQWKLLHILFFFDDILTDIKHIIFLEPLS